MAPRRIDAATSTVDLIVDGERVPAVEGEPVALALAASGRIVLGRSPKYHRPRGATCLAGRCDGCLMRVDGVPNVMTCREPASAGMVIETQNVVGSAERDLLAVTDWFFPDGLDHHHMFTRFGAVNRVMQKVARRVAGIGTLPDAVRPPVAPKDLEVDVLVVGGGPAGLTAARVCAQAGLSVLCVDEEDELGGHLTYVPDGVPGHDEAGGARDSASALVGGAEAAGARLLPRHVVVGVFGPIVAVRGGDALMRVRPRRLIVATGVHEGAACVEGNDMPGVYGLRGAARMLAAGVLPGDRIALSGQGPHVAPLCAALERAGAKVEGPHGPEAVTAVRGRLTPSSVELSDGSKVPCDAVVLGSPVSAAYEIPSQAGARVLFRGGRFVVEADHAGRTSAPWLRAVGECTGEEGASSAMDHAAVAAADLLTELRAEDRGGGRG